MDEISVTQQDIELTTADARRLPATVYRPAASNGIAIQVNSATLVPRGYYRAFAEFLCSRGFTVLTYDCRAVAVSGKDLRHETSGVVDWGRHDQPAATVWLRGNLPGLRLAIVAHSLGGQILGLSPWTREAKAILMVGTAHGYWRDWPLRMRTRFFARNLFSLPLQILMHGYAPNGMGPGLPLSAQAVRDFARFQRHPHFFCDEQGRPLRPHNDELRMPLRHITFSDDEVVPPTGIIKLDMFYPHAQWKHEHRTPADYGVARVGHFGFFRRSMPVAAWEDVAAWLERVAGE